MKELNLKNDLTIPNFDGVETWRYEQAVKQAGPDCYVYRETDNAGIDWLIFQPSIPKSKCNKLGYVITRLRTNKDQHLF